MLSHQLNQNVIDGEKTIIQNPNEAQRKEHEKFDFELPQICLEQTDQGSESLWSESHNAVVSCPKYRSMRQHLSRWQPTYQPYLPALLTRPSEQALL